MFNPHCNVTSDGVLITEGMVVWTNDLRVGKVVADKDADSYPRSMSGNLCGRSACCKNNQHNHAQVLISGAWFSDHKAGQKAADEKCYCRHDHWFLVESQGRFNGERLAVYFNGKKAEL